MEKVRYYALARTGDPAVMGEWLLEVAAAMSILARLGTERIELVSFDRPPGDSNWIALFSAMVDREKAMAYERNHVNVVGCRVYHRRADLFGVVALVDHDNGRVKVKYSHPYDEDADPVEVPAAELVPA